MTFSGYAQCSNDGNGDLKDRGQGVKWSAARKSMGVSGYIISGTVLHVQFLAQTVECARECHAFCVCVCVCETVYVRLHLRSAEIWVYILQGSVWLKARWAVCVESEWNTFKDAGCVLQCEMLQCQMDERAVWG